MTPAAIMTALQTQLQNSADLNYVPDCDIFIGKRVNITNYPVIVINEAPEKKVADEYPFELWKMNVVIAAGLKVFEEGKQIVGDSNIKGIYDFKNDIRKALSADHTLAGAAINLNILDDYPDDSSDYPIRAFAINIEVLYRQERLTRT
jgi:hypothetical protein